MTGIEPDIISLTEGKDVPVAIELYVSTVVPAASCSRIMADLLVEHDEKKTLHLTSHLPLTAC